MIVRRRIAESAGVVAFAFACFFPSVAKAEWPTLPRAIELARTHALDVVGANADVGFAKAEMAGARKSILGNPYTDIQVDRASDTGIVQALSYTYFPLDIGGQRGARIDEAEKLVAWRKIGLVDARAQATGQVVAAYGAVAVAAERVTQTIIGEQTAREEAKYFAGRLEAKDTTVYEKALADAEVARWVQSHAEAELRLTTSRATLMMLTGLSEPGAPAPADVVPPKLRGSWDDAFVSQVLERSPALARLTGEQSYWDASLERYKTERFPPLALELIGGRGSSGEMRYGAGLMFTFPITHRFQGEIARAEAGRMQAQARADVLRNVVAARLKAARDAVRNVNKAIEELDKNGMPALEQAVEASVEAFKLGKIELTRVLLARRDLSLARSRRLDLLEAAWHAYADLTTLSGDLP